MAKASKELLATALAFGVITEGLNAEQVQEALSNSEGYKRCLAAENALSDALQAMATAEAKVAELESDLATANQQLQEATTAKEDIEKEVESLKNVVEDCKNKIANPPAADTQSAPTSRDGYVTYNGLKYGFTDNAPARLMVEGRLYTQEELLNDKEIITDLIVGGSAFIKRIV